MTLRPLPVYALLVIFFLGSTTTQAIQIKIPKSITLKDESGLTFTVADPTSTGEISIDDKSKQCLTDAFETAGEAWHVNISAGGVTLFANQYTTVTPLARGQALGLGTIKNSAQTVNILVIDKFGTTTFPLKENKSGPELQMTLNHGGLVVAHIREILKADNNRVQIRTLDIDDIHPGSANASVTTADVVNALQNKWSRLEINFNLPLIINLSIAILPCEIQSHYFQLSNAAELLNPPRRLPFRKYLDGIAQLNGHGSDAAQYIKSIIVPSNLHDPLQKWLREQKTIWKSNRAPFVVVASSGNYGLPFQTMPAAWPEVLGVAASTVVKPTSKTYWSDAGDVLDVGEWYTFDRDPFNPSFNKIISATFINGSGNPTPYTTFQRKDFAYRGTSFAAPTVTASLAIAMGKPSSLCFKAGTREFDFDPLSLKKGNLQGPIPVFSTSYLRCLMP